VRTKVAEYIAANDAAKEAATIPTRVVETKNTNNANAKTQTEGNEIASDTKYAKEDNILE
jgi:hypothetical protein